MNVLTKKRSRTLKQSSKITNAPAYPSLLQEKASRFLLYWALQLGKMNPGDLYELPLESLREALNCRNDQELKKILVSLVDYKINWELFYKARVESPYIWGFSSLLADCVITKNHAIKYSFSPLMVQELFKPHSYRIFDIEVLMAFKSAYAFKIYQLCGQYYNEEAQYGRTISYTLEDLRILFNVDEAKYSKRYDFIQKVIALPLQEVNEVSSYIAEFKDDNGKPSCRRYWFEIRCREKKPKVKAVVQKSKVDHEREEMLKKLNDVKEKFLSLPAPARKEIREKAISNWALFQIMPEDSRKEFVDQLQTKSDEDFPATYYIEVLEEYLAPTLPLFE